MCDVPLKNITFMGHSLGAHVSGFAVKDFQKSGYGKIPLLITTNPAYPLFMFSNCEGRLCKKNAERSSSSYVGCRNIKVYRSS